MKQEYNIKTKNVDDRKAILSMLFTLGFKWHGENDWNPNTVEEKYPYVRYPNLCIAPSRVYVCGKDHTQTYNCDDTLDDVREAIVNSKVITNFSKTGYDAIITKDEVKVGCQTISKGKIQELLNVMNDTKVQPDSFTVLNVNQTSYEVWLRFLENLGWRYTVYGDVKNISEAISQQHWKRYKYLSVRFKTTSGEVNTICGTGSPYEVNFENPFDEKAFDLVLNNTQTQSETTMYIGDYEATVYNDRVELGGYTITREAVETVVNSFNELSN